MKKRRVFKGHTFSLRVPEKVRYGLDLLARKRGSQMSALVLRAIEKMFEDEGLDSRGPGELFSLLDRLWAESPAERYLAIVEHAPKLATPEEFLAGSRIQRLIAEGATRGIDRNAVMAQVVFHTERLEKAT